MGFHVSLLGVDLLRLVVLLLRDLCLLLIVGHELWVKCVIAILVASCVHLLGIRVALLLTLVNWHLPHNLAVLSHHNLLGHHALALKLHQLLVALHLGRLGLGLEHLLLLLLLLELIGVVHLLGEFHLIHRLSLAQLHQLVVLLTYLLLQEPSNIVIFVLLLLIILHSRVLIISLLL